MCYLFAGGPITEDIYQAAQQLSSRWEAFCALLVERLAWLDYQSRILAFYNLYQQLEQSVASADTWVKLTPLPPSEPEPIRNQLERCRVIISIHEAEDVYQHTIFSLFDLTISSTCRP